MGKAKLNVTANDVKIAIMSGKVSSFLETQGLDIIRQSIRNLNKEKRLTFLGEDKLSYKNKQGNVKEYKFEEFAKFVIEFLKADQCGVKVDVVVEIIKAEPKILYIETNPKIKKSEDKVV